MRLWNLGACVLALLVVACGGESVNVNVPEAGTLKLPLTSPSSDGKVYRLVGATFDIAGPQTVTLTDTSSDTVLKTLQVGSYTIQLADGWHMERVDAPGTAVPATLMSPNPLPFFVTNGKTTEVRFQFKLPGEGSADVGIHVDNGGWLAGTLQFTEREGSMPGAFDELVGKSVPFLISFESATYTREDFADKRLRVQTGPVTVQFGGAPSELLARAAASLNGSPLDFTLQAMSPTGTLMFREMHFLSGPDAFQFMLDAPIPFQGAVDPEGYPAVRTFELDATATLRDAHSGEGVRGTASVNGSP